MEIMDLFLEHPEARLTIRETARRAKVNPMTARSKLLKLEDDGLIAKEKGDVYPVFTARKETRQFRNRKLFWTLERIRTSKLIEALEEAYDLPAIILFGSCAKGTDTAASDMDLCVITDVSRRFDPERYGKSVGHPISLHIFSENEWELLRKKNHSLRRNIQSGITLTDTVAP